MNCRTARLIRKHCAQFNKPYRKVKRKYLSLSVKEKTQFRLTITPKEGE